MKFLERLFGSRTARKAEQRPARARAYTSNWGSVYEAANRSDFRGYFYFPTLAPHEQLNTLSLRALRERVAYLYKNVGAATMLIDRLSLAESGTGAWPKWTTGDEAFDKACTDAYHFANHDPRIFSADAQQDGYSVQYAIRRGIALYGDCFGQLLRASDGTSRPPMSLIPGYQCDNFGDEPKDSGWRDGVLRNAFNRPIAYKFISQAKDGKRTAQIVPADDVLHFHDPFLPGQIRGEPALASVAKKMFRREDIGHALANGTLARERLGFAIESASDGGGPRLELGGDGESEELAREDGSKWTVRKIFGERVNDEIEIPELPAGSKITTVESNRPGTAVMEFQDAILREAAWSRKYPAEFVFFMAGVGQGTVSREIRQAASEIILQAREFQMRPQFLIRHPVFWAWQMIRAGYFDSIGVAVPDNWWTIKVIMPALPTVDVGREGALHDNRVATGKESIEFYHGSQGEDASDVEDENTNAIRRRHVKLKKLNADLARDGFEPLRYQDIWSRNVNIQPPMESPAGGNRPGQAEDPDE